MAASRPVVLIPSVLRLTFVQNTGAAFGLFPGRQPVFMATSLFVLFVIAAYWRRVRPRQWPVVVALALVTAGATGNLIDRAFIGQVTDFFEFTFVDFPVFNIADMCIILGVGILMVWVLFGPDEEGSGDVSAVRESHTDALSASGPDAAEPPASSSNADGESPQ